MEKGKAGMEKGKAEEGDSLRLSPILYENRVTGTGDLKSAW
jgi:hypothetical protein